MVNLNPEHSNLEIKSSPGDIPKPEPVKATETDKEKLQPKENGDSAEKKDSNKAGNKSDVNGRPEHPKLEVKNNSDYAEPVINQLRNSETEPYSRIHPSEALPSESNIKPAVWAVEQTKPNELSPYAKEKLDHFPKDAPEQIRPAYERACFAEPRITQDMKDITATAPGSHLEGLDYRLKDGDSFARKANAVSENKGIPLEDAANSMHDLNRYTQVSDGDHLVDNANNSLAALKEKGYNIDDVNSTWGDPGAYKGINCKLTSPEGQPCELQFHTPESLATKEPMHKLYEDQRKLPEGSPEWNAYEDRMREMSSSLTPPKNIENLKTQYD